MIFDNLQIKHHVDLAAHRRISVNEQVLKWQPFQGERLYYKKIMFFSRFWDFGDTASAVAKGITYA